MLCKARVVLAVASLVTGAPAHAGRPLDTDDAAIIPTGACQVESFARRLGSSGDTRAATDFGLAPSCNPFGRSELLIGTERDGVGAGAPVSHAVLQFKTVPQQVTVQHWGWGFSGAVDEAFARGQGRPAGRVSALNAITSVPVATRWQVDANAGWIHEWAPAPSGHRDRAVWAFAGEWAVSPRTTVVAERVGTTGQGSRSLVGTAFAVTRAVTLDAAVGQRHQTGDRGVFVTAGITILIAAGSDGAAPVGTMAPTGSSR